MPFTTTFEFPFRVLFTNQFFDPNIPITPASKLVGFLKLQNGWCNGKGIRISHSVIQRAQKIIREANGGMINSVDVFPRQDGGVTVAVYFLGRDLAFNLKPDGTINVDSETDVDFPLLEKLSLTHALFIIQGLRQWNSSFSSTFPSTTSNSVGFGVPASRIPGMERVSQLSTANALTQRRVPYAIMPGLSMVG